MGYGLSRDHVNSGPADVLVQGWDRGKPAAFNATVTSPLTPVILNNASASVGSAAYAAESRKYAANDTKCQELGWTCIPLAVERPIWQLGEGGSVCLFLPCNSVGHQPVYP